MTRRMYAPEPEGVREASSSAFEFFANPKNQARIEAARRAVLAADNRTKYEREEDRVIDERARGLITEREKNEALRAIKEAARRDEDRAKDRKRGRS